MDHYSELTPLRSLPQQLDAMFFNRVRLALLRIAQPLQIELGHLRIDLTLTRDLWSGTLLNQDAPVLAWTDFVTKDRNNLTQPIACTVHYYHFHAGLLMSPILSGIDRVVSESLDEWSRAHHAREKIRPLFHAQTPWR